MYKSDAMHSRYLTALRKPLFLLLFFHLPFLAFHLYAQSHWECIVRAQDQWRYLNAFAAPPSGWYNNGFDDADWTLNTGSFGYGDDDDSTYVDVDYSLYLRHSFQVSDITKIDSLLLDIDYDDAFVVYLNGQPAGRSYNVDTDYPAYNYEPSVDQEASMYKGGAPSRVSIPKALLQNGENLLAIQGINYGTSSSDFSLAPFLLVKIDDPGMVYHETPDWFRDPDAPFSSNLPILVVDSEGREIPDEPKITARLGIVHQPEGLNALPGTFNDYDGFVGIEKRGQSSMMFPKTGYGFETRLESGENNNVSIAGLPPENDWVLHGPYSDKSLIRNVLAYHFAAEMGQYAPRTRLCELFVNDSYMGVYVLTEKIKRDTFRVDVGKLTTDEVGGRDITGGYILRIDKHDEGDLFWVSPYLSINNNDIRILYYYPDPDSITPVQQDYIRDFVTGFEHALKGSNYKDPYLGYQPYVDIPSFVDFYLVNELTKNVDGYRISTFFHKDKDKKDRLSPLKAGPVWDFNLGFGNADYYDASVTSGWQSEHPADYWSTPFWWAKMKRDPAFYNTMVGQWANYRSTILSDNRVIEVIDSLTTLLDEAQQRNFEAFPILSQYVWPNNYVGNSYENEISYLKNWILARMAWMDDQLDTPMHPYAAASQEASQALMLFPNPVHSDFELSLMLDTDSRLTVSLHNLLGQCSYREELDIGAGEQHLHFSERMVRESMPEPGIYILQVHANGSLLGSARIVKQ